MLMVAKNGVTMYRIGTVSGDDWSIETFFSHPIASITGWAVADVNADGMKEILLGKWSGFILILNGNGEVLEQALAGSTVYDVATVRNQEGKTHILATTGEGIRIYNGALRLLGEYRLKGCVKLQTARSSSGDVVVAFLRDGNIKTLAL